MSLFNLSIDPGLGGTGWALWKKESWTTLEPPHRWGTWRAGTGEMLERAGRLAQQLIDVVEGLRSGGLGLVQDAWIEWPQFFDNPGGHMTAARGDLTKLVYVVGSLGEAAREHGVTIHPVGIPEWKGQLPKEVCEKRIRAKLGLERAGKRPDHCWDAIGIGLHAKGFPI